MGVGGGIGNVYEAELGTCGQPRGQFYQNMGGEVDKHNLFGHHRLFSSSSKNMGRSCS